MAELNLRDRRKRLQLSQREIARRSGCAPSMISSLEKHGVWPKKEEAVIGIANAYRISHADATRAWLTYHYGNTGVADALGDLLGTNGVSDQTAQDVEALLRNLEGFTHLQRLARSLIQQVLQLLRENQRRQHRSRSPVTQVVRLKDSLAGERFMPIALSSSVTERRSMLHVTRPAWYLVEHLKLAPRLCGYHRQPKPESGWAGSETYCVLHGEAAVVLGTVGGDPEIYYLEKGDSICYDGTLDHVWINTSRTQPLILFQCLFPHHPNISASLRGEVSQPHSGAVGEFRLDEVPEEGLPEAIEQAVRRVRAKMNGSR